MRQTSISRVIYNTEIKVMGEFQKLDNARWGEIGI